MKGPLLFDGDDVQAVLDTLLLIGGGRGAEGIRTWLHAHGRDQTSQGKTFNEAHIRQCLKVLSARGDVALRNGFGHDVNLQAHAGRLDQLLCHPSAKDFARQFAWLMTGAELNSPGLPRWITFRSGNECSHVLRLMLVAGLDHASFMAQVNQLMPYQMSDAILLQALSEPWLPGVFQRMEGSLRDRLLMLLLDMLPEDHPDSLAVQGWLNEALVHEPAAVTPAHRGQLAMLSIAPYELAKVEALTHDLDGPSRPVFDAVGHLARGEWKQASARFEAGLKAMRQALSQRRGVTSPTVSRLYVLSLLAQDDPKTWVSARKFCIGESGSRSPSPHETWGLWAHVIGVRLGEESLQPQALTLLPTHAWMQRADDVACDRLLLAAWLGKPAPGATQDGAQAVLRGLLAQRQVWLACYLTQALERLGLGHHTVDLGERSPPRSYLSPPREAWRDALTAITALADESASAAGTGVELAWRLSLDEAGRPSELLPLERVVGARGGVKLKSISLTKLKKTGALPARDSVVLRHIERDPYSAQSLHLDISQALVALVGHPYLMLDDAPEQWVELVEGQPELEVRRQRGAHDADQFLFHLHPPLVETNAPPLREWYGRDAEQERAKRDSLRVVREGPQRARLIRITPTQRRVAELVSQGWAVPASASDELAAALQVLSGHFQLHSDADGGQLVQGDSRLRARLLPQGEGLQLQLVAQPFGSFGPAVTPGQGRARLMCLHEGLSLATERDLPQEAAHRQAVLEALPFLNAEHLPESPWLLNDPEEALRVVEVLPQLPGMAALDWPKGKPLRVTALASEGLAVKVSSGRDWLALDGQAQLDEQRVVKLQQLMQLARESRSRFVRLGEGDYLALSEQLRQQLRDLDALAQTKKDQLQLPQASASWLDDTLQGMQLQGDKPWLARMDALASASALQPALPPGFRADLRGYQMDGYAWMSRLAHAGLGACLADDMGLGKTVQTLALLVARADRGPALVLAPTSVCGNWLAETAVFAPGLRCRLYGEDSDRAALLKDCGPGDVLVVSYALAQIDGEALAAVAWGTLVMDEAQALKNAATKRAKSVAEFKADFRLALSGTPVENRLADLWSIMNLINPGLLGSAAQFNERFAGPIERQQDAAVRQRLRRLVSPFLLRRTKTQVLQDLPPRTEIIHSVQPSPEEKRFLEALRRSAQDSVAAAAAAGGTTAPMQVLAELMRLRRAACDPRLVAPELGLVGAKLGEFERIVRELVDGGHKALVFSQFTDYLKLLAERLEQMGVPFQTLDGSTPAAQRTQRVAAFQRGEGEVFLISLKAGGFGLNLTMADYVLIVDPWWNPAAEDQATGRAHRMGQQRPVTVYRLVTAGSVEERIIDLHRDKRSLADGMLDDQDQATVLDAQALAALLKD